MKNLSKTLTTILLFVLSTINIYSQFIPAGIAQLAFGITGNVRQTGNDLMDYGMDQIKVSVFDGGNGSAQLAYQVNNGTVGFVNLGSTAAIDPDVVLIVDDNGDLHALVAYYEGTNNAHKLDEFDYSSGVFTHNQTITLNSSTTLNFGTAINIDADDSFNFAVIWDDLGTSKLVACAGYYLSGSLNPGTPTYVGSSSGNVGLYPDVCLFGQGTDVMTYTYVYNGDLYVDEDVISTVFSGSTGFSNITIYTPPSPFTIQRPRIDCPLPANGSKDEWTVVFEETDFSAGRYFICGITSNGSTIYPVKYYNDGGGVITTSLIYELNMDPVVSYTDQSPYGINVGWIYDGSANSAVSAFAHLPILVTCDDIGDITGISDYLEAPFALTNGDYDIGLSLSGKKGADVLYMTWAKDTQSDVVAKIVNPITSVSSLRMQNAGNDEIYNNVLKKIKHINIFDAMGRLIYSSTNQDMYLNEMNQDFLMKFQKGLYLINLTLQDGFQKTYKITLN